jgi:protein-tyrosine phosphatase
MLTHTKPEQALAQDQILNGFCKLAPGAAAWLARDRQSRQSVHNGASSTINAYMSAALTPSVRLQGASNFRDVGGYLTQDQRRVRTGRVFRSDHLAGLTAGDLLHLERLGIGHSLDFRGVAECAATPYNIPGVQRVALTIEPTVIARMQALVAQGVVPTTEETVDLMRETYRDFVNRNASTFGRFLKHLLAEPTPQVFHCTAGKDRTGFGAALLLSALGVDRATIEHDYLLTNQLYRRDPRMEVNGHPHVMKVLWQVQPEFLHAAYEAVDAQHGGMQNYLHGAIGLSSQELAELKRMLLED